MASRTALAVRVADAKDSIAKSMETISTALGVEIPEQPFSPRKNDPDVANALQLDHLAKFLERVAFSVAPPQVVEKTAELVDPVVDENVAEELTIPHLGAEHTIEPVVLEPIPDPAPVVEPVVEEPVVEPKHDKHSKHGKKGR